MAPRTVAVPAAQAVMICGSGIDHILPHTHTIT